MRRYVHGPSIRILAVGCVAAGLAVLAWNAIRPGIRPGGVVIVTLDTTRADRLTPYGFMDASMPHLERLAREGVVFDRAVTPAPLTLPAHAILFTGLYPPSRRQMLTARPGDLVGVYETMSGLPFGRAIPVTRSGSALRSSAAICSISQASGRCSCSRC